MIFEGSMGLYLLVEKRFRGQRLGNVGLNVDEKKRNGEAPRMGLKALGGSAGRPQCSFFFWAIEKKEKKKKLWKKYGEE